jgi:hypothetical protein
MAYSVEWTNEKCDKWDYLIAAFCGIAAGLVDIFFVGTPGASVLGGWADKQADELVKKFAKMTGWSSGKGKENSISSAIGYLEKKFPVNYDQRSTTDVGGAFQMGTTNHHYKSLAHSPDAIGLFFSILGQFQDKAAFLSDGKLIWVDSECTLHGGNLPAKLIAGFCNWLGHIMSDLAGSSGGRGQINAGRGSGVPVPFMELFQLCDFGKLRVGNDLQSFATVMTRVFQEGYDLRFGAALAVPVLINEIMIRILWVVKRHFYEKKEWGDCIPSEKHGNLRIMLIVGYGALCVIDGADAAIRSGGNAVAFILRLNLLAWARLIILVFKELQIRYGDKVLTALKAFLDEIGNILTQNERKLLNEYYDRMQRLDMQLAQLLNEYAEMINREHDLLDAELEASFNGDNTAYDRSEHSVKLAEYSKVNNNEIIRTQNDLDNYFLN